MGDRLHVPLRRHLLVRMVLGQALHVLRNNPKVRMRVFHYRTLRLDARLANRQPEARGGKSKSLRGRAQRHVGARMGRIPSMNFKCSRSPTRPFSDRLSNGPTRAISAGKLSRSGQKAGIAQGIDVAVGIIDAHAGINRCGHHGEQHGQDHWHLHV